MSLYGTVLACDSISACLINLRCPQQVCYINDPSSTSLHQQHMYGTAWVRRKHCPDRVHNRRPGTCRHPCTTGVRVLCHTNIPAWARVTGCTLHSSEAPCPATDPRSSPHCTRHTPHTCNAHRQQQQRALCGAWLAVMLPMPLLLRLLQPPSSAAPY